MKDLIVVVFGGQIEGCPLSHCPMHAHGPYDEVEAREIVRQLPTWMQAHILTLNNNSDACLIDARH